MPQKLCLVCGFSAAEVEKLHNFPLNKQKSKIWQEAMGMVYSPGISLRNHRICSRHFTEASYTNLATRKLRADAVPTLFPCRVQVDPQQELVTSESLDLSGVEEHLEREAVIVDPIPSCSGVVECPSTPTSTRRSVFRGIPGVSHVGATPRKHRLMRMIETKEAHIRKLKSMCKKKANDIRALTDLHDTSVVRNLFGGMSSTTTDFLISQLRCAKRSPHGRRWTNQEKVIALALLKKSPRCYNLLRKIVTLPSKNTLLMMLQKVPFHSGINDHLFKHIADSMTEEEDKYCALLFDEMDIKENLQYDAFLDRIVGFEELGDNCHSKKWANKALVFMLQGLVRNWKQPVAYYFSNGACPANVLQACITNVIKACEQIAGVHVVATICDMGSTNVKTLKEMGSSIEQPYVTIDGKRIFTMFDPPHLLKCTTSLFRKHNIFLPIDVAGTQQIMEARFSDIVKAHNIDQASPLVFRAMHKLKAAHLAPKMQFAMKVNIAAQVMSHTVAAFLYTLLSRGELEQRSLATATFVQQVDELFDSFNGSKALPPDGKELKCCVTKESANLQYWQRAVDMVKQWQFRRLLKTGSLKTSKPPSQIGWLISLNAIRQIWTYLHTVKEVTSLRPRALNQDALENLFGAVRGGCGSSDNPTAVQFAASLKTQILNGLTRQTIKGSNCEEDGHELLTNLSKFLDVDETQHVAQSPKPSTSQQTSCESIPDTIVKAVTQGATNILSVAYVSGFIAKKLQEHIECETCQEQLLATSDSPHNLFISYKEWSNTEHLQYPSEPLVVAVGHAITVLEETLDNLCHQPNLSSLVTEGIMNNVSFSWLSCNDHREFVTRDIVRATWKIGIPWWCKRRNQEKMQARKDARASRRKLRTFKHR